ncbi:DUF3107 domain-containing protein [Microbacterium sp. MPKO10]|uniref:DUF3107 domain-containing protein n=1 Tax=Microbacterium sp. MPKO10 TaxID=2989818 RepID=UPI0022363A81|nr:DUF3107 domain-containing protein [Microbacterium sp. MPKO10]MCW4458104.1 DUF3107 domain-containing protein [Microbacterium sp. MPKO10]
MDIRIGITNSPREINFSTDAAIDDVKKTIGTALSDKAPFFELADDKGNVFVIPTEGVAYVELGNEESRRVGFVA